MTRQRQHRASCVLHVHMNTIQIDMGIYGLSLQGYIPAGQADSQLQSPGSFQQSELLLLKQDSLVLDPALQPSHPT